MTKTAYCHVEPIKSHLDADREAMSMDEEIDVEELLQRWGKGTIDPKHVYADDEVRFQILARKLTESSRIMVGMHDKNDDLITLTAVRDGPHQSAVNTAYRFRGRNSTDLPRKQGWQP